MKQTIKFRRKAIYNTTNAELPSVILLMETERRYVQEVINIALIKLWTCKLLACMFGIIIIIIIIIIIDMF